MLVMLLVEVRERHGATKYLCVVELVAELLHTDPRVRSGLGGTLGAGHAKSSGCASAHRVERSFQVFRLR